MKLNYRKLNPDAITPIRASKYAAGVDLYACTPNFEMVRVPAGETVMIGTGIAVEIPEGCFGAVFARSGMATKLGLRPANCVGVIDSDYRGEVMVAIHNDSGVDATIASGERIAQLVIIPYVAAPLVEVEELTQTERGDGGFGSTGVL